jgi:hypothetical protein
MPDVHWIGGDPNQGQVYGYAAWTPQKAVLSFRNPSAEKKIFTITTASAFDLPSAFKGKAYAFYTVNKENTPKLFSRGQSISLTLEPFETVVFDAVPR